MVQAGEAETTLQGAKQREMSVEVRAGFAVRAEVGVDDGGNLVGVGRLRVVVFIPDDNDGILALAPYRRSLDRGDDLLYCLVAQNDQRGIQTSLAAIVIGIKVAERAGITATVLVVAL